MASLTRTAYMSRMIIKYGGVVLLVFILLRWGVKAGVAYWNAAHPEPPAPPTVRYGRLPKIVFPKQNLVGFEFYLETADGELPEISDRVKVYFSPQISTAFLALESAKKKAVKMGFSAEPEKIREDQFRFYNGTDNRTLIMNVLTGAFQLSYPYLEDQTLINPSALLAEEQAKERALSFLSGAGVAYDDLKGGEKLVSFWKIKPSTLVEAMALSEADLVRVDFFRQPIEDEEGVKKIMGTSPQKASVSVLLSGGGMESKQIVEVNFAYAPIDLEENSTYPLKAAAQAWQEVKAGQYYLAQKPKEGTRAAVRRAYLAYFEPNTTGNFIMPIWVFEGDGGVVIYVSAVAEEWLVD